MAGPRAVIVVAADAKEAVAEFQKLQTTFNATKDHATSLSNVMAGIGQGLGIAGVLGVANVVGTLKNVLEDSVRAAMEDERSVVRLGVALRDNVVAWNGNTDAIEKAVAARTRLGFEDDVLRQSLGTLVTRTHDVNRAMELMDQAMDLARFRGIDLAAATDLIGKAFDGNVGALRRAGIAVKANATAAEALAAVLKATGGQAEAFATTSLGKMEAASVRAGESLERLGARVLPLVADGVDLAAGTVDLLTTAVDGLTLPFQAAEKGAKQAAEGTQVVGYQAAWATQQINSLTPALNAATTGSINLKYAAINAAGALDTLGASAASVSGWTGYVVNAQTGFVLTQKQVNQAIVDGANAHQNYVSKIKTTTTATGGLSRATDELTRKMKDQLAKAFDTFKASAIAALDAVHAKKLRAIEDARKLRDAELEAQAAAIQGAVDAERKKLEEARDARRQRELEQAVADAAASGDMEAMAQAQQNLQDFLDDQRIEKLQADADAQLAAIDKEKQANDQKAQDLTDAENARYEKLKAGLDKQLKLLEEKLTEGDTKWKVHLAAIQKILGDSVEGFGKVGKEIGDAFNQGFETAISQMVEDMIRAVGKAIGLTGSQIEDAVKQWRGGHAAGKALGGPVSRGIPYIVGERGPELFVPSASGTIVPNDRLVAGGGSTAVNVTISGPAVFDPLGVGAQQLAALLIPAINRERTRQGTM